MAAAVGKYKRLFAASTALAVALALVLLGLLLTEGPERITLGTGRAGVMDTAASAAPIDGQLTPGEDGGRELPEGDASYYGDELAGEATASGERFDPERLTAAHRTLPFGTRLRVTNVRNDRSVVVTVNDRGPYSGDRVLDLSYAAARQLRMVQQGEARVRMEVLM